MTVTPAADPSAFQNAGVRDWPIWKLRRWLGCYVIGVVSCYVLAVAVSTAVTPFHARDAELFGVLILFGLISIELTRHEGEATEFTKDVQGIWNIPIAILLPPVYSMLTPVAKMLLTQWRVDRKPLHRRAFTGSAVGLSYGAASCAFHRVAPHLPAVSTSLGRHWVFWAFAAAACALLQSVANTALVAVAVKGADPTVNLRRRQFSRDPLYNDLAEQTVGTLLAVLLAATGAWLLTILALPLVTLLHRSLRHAQLTDAARLDAKTGLLNAATWTREASAEINRAARTGTPVTLAMVDVDHFKQVNDTYGHLAGDSVLITLSAVMRGQLRDYDIVGRFGGEEFTILFPHTDVEAARQIAERLRATAGRIAIPADGLANPGEQEHISISIGVTTMSSSETDLDELIRVADSALYYAKTHGRNRVCVLAGVPWPREGCLEPG